MAKQQETRDEEHHKAMLMAFYADPEEKKAEFARQMGITHLVSAKYDTECRLKHVEAKEKEVAAAAVELEKILAPKPSNEKVSASLKRNPVDPKATKAA